jgi:hypothetical protein
MRSRTRRARPARGPAAWRRGRDYIRALRASCRARPRSGRRSRSARRAARGLGADRLLFDSQGGAAAPAIAFDWSRSRAATICRRCSPAASAANARAARASAPLRSTSARRSRWRPGARIADKVAPCSTRFGRRARELRMRLTAASAASAAPMCPKSSCRRSSSSRRRSSMRRRIPRSRRARRAAGHLRRPADAADPLPQPRRGQGAHLSQARGSAPRRRAQDQPGARPGLLAKRMGKTRLIAETGAGQHGVATAMAARCSASRPGSTWAPRTSSGSSSTSSGWS